MKAKVIGVDVGVYSRKVVENGMIESGERAARLLGASARVASRDVIFNQEYVGPGYGIPTKESIDALRLAARTDAIILDPVYTSKAMAGLIGMVKRGELKKDENVCFLHTGGIPALFPYRKHFQPRTE